ncbi:MAG: DUF4388 domain-containing protein [Gammaproteobacteria bacterium]|nr:DUF4388 domain-containing protein [Gammaproteobacteria bacterium]
MNAETVSLPYDRLMEKLLRLCREERSGTMFITTERGHAARIALDSGKIVSCTYRLKQGMTAIPLLMKINSAAYHFAGDVFDSSGDASLPATDLLLGWLTSGDFSSGPITSKPAARQPQQPSPSPQPSADYSANREIKTISRVLAEYIGPIATLTVDDYLERFGIPAGPDDITEMVDTLAGEEINEPAARLEFKRKVKDQLG